MEAQSGRPTAGRDVAGEGRSSRGLELFSLPAHLLVAIIRAAQTGTQQGGGKRPEGGSLLRLRSVSCGFRDVVDEAIEDFSFRVMSRNASPASLLPHVLDALRTRLPRWPNLATLHIAFEWTADELRTVLATIARACPRLRTLRLEAGPQALRWEEGKEPCLAPLGELPTLQHLALTGFQAFPHWSQGLSLLANLATLDLDDVGPATIEPLPRLTTLQVRNPDRVPRIGLPDLGQSTTLRQLVLSGVSLEWPSVGTSLEELVLKRVGVQPGSSTTQDATGALGRLLTGPPCLPHLRVLHLDSVAGDVPTTLSLAACTGLTSLVLSELLSVQAIAALGHLRGLKCLELKYLKQLRRLPDLGPGCFPSLKRLELVSLERLERLPHLAAFPNLAKLELVDLKHAVVGEDLVVLTSLERLKIHRCRVLELPSASLPNTLPRLTCLDLLRLKQAHNNQPCLLGPGPALVPNLKTLTLSQSQTSNCREIGCMSKLEQLRLCAIVNLQDLLPNLRLLTSLAFLSISHCDKIRVIDVGWLHALKRLEVENLPVLRLLVGLERVQALRTIMIKRCPLIKEADLPRSPNLRVRVGNKWL